MAYHMCVIVAKSSDNLTDPLDLECKLEDFLGVFILHQSVLGVPESQRQSEKRQFEDRWKGIRNLVSEHDPDGVYISRPRRAFYVFHKILPSPFKPDFKFGDSVYSKLWDANPLEIPSLTNQWWVDLDPIQQQLACAGGRPLLDATRVTLPAEVKPTRLGTGGHTGAVVLVCQYDFIVHAGKFFYIDRPRPLENILREIHLQSKCDHSSVLEIIGVMYLPAQQLIGIIMPIQEMSLAKFMERDTSQVTEYQRIYIAYHLARGYAHLKAKGIAHLDGHPGNILLSKRRGSDNVEVQHPKIADFSCSVAYKAGEPLPRFSSHYTSPEMLDRQVQTGKEDEFTFGVTMVQLFSDFSPPLMLSRQPKDSSKASIKNEIIRALLVACINPIPDMRPNFDEIISVLGQQLNESLPAREQPADSYLWDRTIQTYGGRF
eukprot:TRINITY_DN12463_c0_g1_i2.p1 TRINITY_DN12463_c0_g1~~TRINITY_DN12463_c0_g1_i2.p1  ORF type:complete len:464 (-),score=-14.72 TRINITY_DN12463_c0_g1_i2:111-1403(-)